MKEFPLCKKNSRNTLNFSIIEIEPIIGDSVIVNISISEGEDVFIKDTYIEGVDSKIIILLKENCYIKMGIV